MKNRRNYYRILQVQPDAPLEIIRASYRTIMRELMQHPDFGGDHWIASTINEAYETLSDSDKRAEYDKQYSKYISIKTASKTDFRKKYFNSVNNLASEKPTVRHSTANKSLKSIKTQKVFHDNFHRSVNRVQMKETLQYYITSSKKGREAIMLNLSPKGIRFICSEKLTHESTIKIGCSLFKAEAEVVNYNKNLSTDKPNYSVGARFLTIQFRNQTGSFYSNVV